jgi:Flp pilus assembly protein TadG
VVSSEKGSALIWFVFLVAILCLVVLTLASAVHQYLFARELIDFTEQFALGVKTRYQLQPGSNISSLASSLLQEVASQYSFSSLQLRQVSLETGETVRVIFCAKWESPIASVSASRTICEVALAR